MACWAGGIYGKVERKIYEHIIIDKRRGRRRSGAWGGGTSIEALKRIEVLEKELSDLKKTIATTDKYGLSKITRAMDVTETASGLVLSAKEKNPLVQGSLAEKIEQIKGDLQSFHPSAIAGMTDKNKSESANVILYKYSDTNWAGIGCATDGVPVLRCGHGAYAFGWDGIYFNGVKITK